MTKLVRIAAMADVHYGKELKDSLQSAYRAASEQADVLLVCGDITNYGLPEEASVALQDLRAASIPVIAVLGNHDFESGREAEVRAVLESGGIKVLDGETCEVGGVGFAGVKGFCGGFGRRTLEPWGEKAMKMFVQETVSETMKLESALARLRMPQRIVVLHYAPIQATVEGEPPEIFPFLGSSRLEDPINRHGCAAVFHGHAHRGAPEGKTQTGIPVYNVSVSLLRASAEGSPPFRLFEVELQAAEEPAKEVAAAGAHEKARAELPARA
jgi:Icc-related predicted phosphoesterase